MENTFLLEILRIVINFLLPFLVMAGRVWSLKHNPGEERYDVAWRIVFALLALFFAAAFFSVLFGWDSLAWLNPRYRRGGTLLGLVFSVFMACLPGWHFKAGLEMGKKSR